LLEPVNLVSGPREQSFYAVWLPAGFSTTLQTRKEAHMKSQLSKPARTKVSYTEEYKREALQRKFDIR
jgi:hypothetical protein